MVRYAWKICQRDGCFHFRRALIGPKFRDSRSKVKRYSRKKKDINCQLNEHRTQMIRIFLFGITNAETNCMPPHFQRWKSDLFGCCSVCVNCVCVHSSLFALMLTFNIFRFVDSTETYIRIVAVGAGSKKKTTKTRLYNAKNIVFSFSVTTPPKYKVRSANFIR